MINTVLNIILTIVLIFVILLFLAWLFNVALYLISNKEKAFSPRYYLKDIPFFVNKSAMYRVRTAGQFLGLILFTTIVGFTFFNNTTPLGVTLQYAMEQDTKNISKLSPKDRVKTEIVNGETLLKQIGDIVYFNTEMPFQFDYATVRVFFKNPSLEQTFSIGFQDREEWHYDTKPYDIPYINPLSWTKNGNDPVLYQRDRKYVSVDDFINNPPLDSIIGTFEHETNIGNLSQYRIPTYNPQLQETIIDTPLRGKHTIYAYLEKEKFNMTIIKQDLNWYEDTDVAKIKIYKDEDLVYQVTIEDDGIQDSSKKILPAQEITINNPGNELPENGVYKIVIDANGDTIIKKIKTNLHKIVFANSIFPVTNKDVYPGVAATTSATTVYTNALTLSATTYHDQGKQNILVGNQVLGVNTLHSASYLAPKENISEVIIPQNDVVLNGFLGYFAFERDQFFLPTKYHILPITKAEDVELVDYILTDYLPSRTEGEWQVNEQTFDLRTAYIKDGKLSWIIKAPKLKERGGEIIIKDIQITFHKRGWL